LAVTAARKLHSPEVVRDQMHNGAVHRAALTHDRLRSHAMLSEPPQDGTVTDQVYWQVAQDYKLDKGKNSLTKGKTPPLIIFLRKLYRYSVVSKKLYRLYTVQLFRSNPNPVQCTLFLRAPVKKTVQLF
jgi:hypothetical protein